MTRNQIATGSIVLLTLAAISVVGVSGEAAGNLGDGSFANVTLRGGFTPDPRSISVVSGGNVQASAYAVGCPGYVAEVPDVVVHYREPADLLRFYVEGLGDTTLLINDPSGEWHCVDDSVGLLPLVSFQWPMDGRYDVWIGSYDPGEYHDVVLSVTELRSQRPIEE